MKLSLRDSLCQAWRADRRLRFYDLEGMTESMTFGEFGEKVAIWDGNPDVPGWLKDSVGHEILIFELARRLKRRPSEATEYTVEASPEPEGDGSRWRVRLIWEDVPSLDMVLAFDGLDVDPRLVTVGAGPKPESESAPADDALVEGSVPDPGSELQ